MYDWRGGSEDLYYREGQQAESRGVVVYMGKVMGWMCVGLLTTLVASLLCLSSPAMMNLFLYNTNAIYAACMLQFAVVVAMSAAVRRVNAAAATVMFMAYAALTGVTFSVLFLLFELSSLVLTFGITAAIFISMSVYGLATKRDLTRIGTLAIFGLIGIIIAGVVNIFLRSGMLNFAITCIGIVIFIALTAYDTQKIKGIYYEARGSGLDEESPELRKLAIYGALTLYLDFINLFLKLLMLLGKRRN